MTAPYVFAVLASFGLRFGVAQKMWILTPGQVFELMEISNSSILTAEIWDGVNLPPSLKGATAHVARDSRWVNSTEEELDAAVILA